MTTNIRELLQTPVDSIERPRSLPKGHYIGIIVNGEFGTTRGKQTPYYRLILKPEEAAEDVDQKLLAGIDLSKRELRVDMWITPASLYRLDEMLVSILGPNPNKRTIDDRLPETNGQKVLIAVEPRFDEQGKDTGYNNVTSVTSADETVRREAEAFLAAAA